MPEYLKKRGNRYYVRVPVPKPLWPSLGRDVVRTTGTSDLQEARRRRFAIIADIQAEIQRAENADPATRTWLEQQAAAIRKSVSRGEMDDQLASDIIGQLRDKHLKARGKSPDGNLSADDESHLSAVTRLAIDPEFVPLSGLIEQYLEEKRPVLRASTVDAKQRLLSAFADWVGSDTDINDVARKLTGNYVSTALVSNGKNVKTNQDTITGLSTFWNWAIRRGSYDHANPWTGLGQTLGTSSRGSSKSQPRRWTDQQLVKLFETIPSGPQYYLREMCALALYTGARQNELAELEVTDIDLQKRTIHIGEAKTQSSVRDVPIHPKLLPVIKSLIGKRKDGFLFETFKPAGRDKKRGHEFSKRFAYYRDKTFPETLYATNEHGHKRSVVNFHSFRRAFTNACELSGIPEATTKQLVGHARQSLTYGTYSAGVDLNRLREAIEKVSFGSVDMMIQE
ncbi:MAG: tyrosine-type recombinase/integrase [Pseudomonadota bacterium]